MDALGEIEAGLLKSGCFIVRAVKSKDDLALSESLREKRGISHLRAAENTAAVMEKSPA